MQNPNIHLSTEKEILQKKWKPQKDKDQKENSTPSQKLFCEIARKIHK